MNWTKDEVIKEIQRRGGENQPLYSHHMRKNCPELLTAGMRYYGSWKEAVQAAGIEYDNIRKYKNWTNESIIKSIQELNAQGVDLSFRAIVLSKHAPLVYAAIRPKRFGSWRAALLGAGLAPQEIYRYRSWDDESILTEIQRLNAMGADLSSKKMDETANSLISTARRRFGNWSEALARAGIEYEAIRKRRRWTKEKIGEEIKKLHGTKISLAGKNIRQSHPSLYAAATKPCFFGSWINAVEAQGIAYHDQVNQRPTQLVPQGSVLNPI
ncbi:MAG: hypothetical protein SGI71_11215 [Verrucomicrobiota bacterium]|nr:hypothetical protein [Verrucomicrobiota bacterium]